LRNLNNHSMPHARSRLARRTAGIGITALATVAAGIATASTASADTNWDAIAQCESGGNWSTSTGNGFSGGLQFSASTWRAYGGGSYSSSASAASREQQVAVAERVLAGQGIGAWPTCGSRSGSSAASTAASRSTTRSAPKAVTPRKVATPKATVKTNVRSTKPAKAVATSGRTVTVRAGDTLSQLSASLGVSGGWQALYATNKSAVNNPNLIYVGQVLHLPG
jgi:nucleoid-associated protein YgaU